MGILLPMTEDARKEFDKVDRILRGANGHIGLVATVTHIDKKQNQLLDMLDDLKADREDYQKYRIVLNSRLESIENEQKRTVGKVKSLLAHKDNQEDINLIQQTKQKWIWAVLSVLGSGFGILVVPFALNLLDKIWK